MKKIVFILTSLIVVLCSCSKNEVEVEVKEKTDNDSIVVVYSDDRTSNGMTFYEIDFDNFYLDNVKYTFTYPLQGDAHLVVSGYNKNGDCSNLKIVSAVEMDGTIFKVLKIAENAFQGCSNMTSLKLPKGLITIGDYAFKGCDRLTSINIPESVTEIDYDAFSGCDNLDTLELHADKNWLYSINYLNSIKNVIFGDGVHKIQSDAFKNWASLTSISLSNSVEEIGSYAFGGCRSLSSIEIPNSVTSIGFCAFRNTPALNTIRVDEKNPKYDSRDNCNAIIETESNILMKGCKNTVIPNGVTKIWQFAFDGCTNMSYIKVPSTVTLIHMFAFTNCDDLKTVYCDALTPPSAYYAFDLPQEMTLYVPSAAIDKYKAHEDWKQFKNIQPID